MDKFYRMGLDIGSTTIKVVILDGEEIIYKDITKRLQESLGTKVSIVRGPKKNKIEIEYYSEEELERLVELLGKR